MFVYYIRTIVDCKKILLLYIVVTPCPHEKITTNVNARSFREDTSTTNMVIQYDCTNHHSQTKHYGVIINKFGTICSVKLIKQANVFFKTTT